MLAQQTDTETDLAAIYYSALHAKCPILRRGRLECAWAPSGYCSNCGRPIPTLLANQPGSLA